MFHAQVLAEEMMYLHGLQDWRFSFDRAKKRFGLCNYGEKKISLSSYLVALNPEKVVRDVILHEIAHALAGYQAGHGRQWKEVVLRIGGNPSRCYGEEVMTPLLKYTATCPQCKKSIQRKIKRKISCGECCKKFSGGRFDERFLLEFELNNNC